MFNKIAYFLLFVAVVFQLADLARESFLESHYVQSNMYNNNVEFNAVDYVLSEYTYIQDYRIED